jgi:predicted porin
VPKSDDAAKVADTNTPSASGKSAYSAFFVGDLGVKGLQVALEKAQNEKNGTASDQKVTAFGASYTMGDFSIGAERQKFTDVTKAETETTEFGLTYKINNNASVGIGKIKTEGKDATGEALDLDEEIKYLQIGYNLGGYTAQVSVIDVDNVEFVDTKDSKAYVFKLATRF